MDGTGMVRAFSAMLSTDPHDSTLTPLWAQPLPTAETPGGSVDTRAVLELMCSAKRFAAEWHRPTDPAFAVPLTGARSALLNGRLSPRRSWATTGFDVARLRNLAEQTCASVNEVLMAALATALRAHLAGRGEDHDGRSLIAAVPVASRSGVADPRHDAGGMILVNLFTDRPDPVERLRGIIRSSALAKRHLDTLSAAAADRYAVLTFGPFMVQQLAHLSGRVRPPFNVTVSNVPGPRSQQYLLGAAQQGLAAAANLGHGQRLNVTVLSTGPHLEVGFTGCAVAFADIDRLAMLFSDAVDELELVLSLP
jgi:WS/DGAT/MGAT family acyltransferase